METMARPGSATLQWCSVALWPRHQRRRRRARRGDWAAGGARRRWPHVCATLPCRARAPCHAGHTLPHRPRERGPVRDATGRAMRQGDGPQPDCQAVRVATCPTARGAAPGTDPADVQCAPCTLNSTQAQALISVRAMPTIIPLGPHVGPSNLTRRRAVQSLHEYGPITTPLVPG